MNILFRNSPLTAASVRLLRVETGWSKFIAFLLFRKDLRHYLLDHPVLQHRNPIATDTTIIWRSVIRVA